MTASLMAKYGSMHIDFRVSPESFGIDASRSTQRAVNRSNVYGWMFVILTFLFVPGIGTVTGVLFMISPYRMRAALETCFVIIRT